MFYFLFLSAGEEEEHVMEYYCRFGAATVPLHFAIPLPSEEKGSRTVGNMLKAHEIKTHISVRTPDTVPVVHSSQSVPLQKTNCPKRAHMLLYSAVSTA